jgi:hypothetical protein
MKLSLCLASIRTYNLVKLYNSARTSCKKHDWEMIISSPFPLPNEMNLPNVKYVRDYGSPTRATQMGISLCSGTYITFPCDDGVFLENALDAAVEFIETKDRKDGLVMRYKEGGSFMDNPDAPSFSNDYWNANHHIRGIGWDDSFKIAPQPLFRLDYLKELGGFNCIDFECMSFSTWDICGRSQKNGSIFHLSPLEVMRCDNYGAVGVDHRPIYDAHGKDHDRFIEMQRNVNINIDFDNWKLAPEVWSRRFKKLYNSHQEMMEDL